jgi:iron complex outermembrane receptor protein
LYWYDAYDRGNINLQPENAWSEEISINTIHKISTFRIDFTSTVFNRLMDNYIQWVPTQNYYSPQNVKQVWSRGIEGNLKCTLPLCNCNFIYNGRINYVLSTNEKSDIINDATLHKQLMYMPMFTYMNQITAIYKSFFVSFNQTYTGNRFTTSDESYELKYYLSGNVSAGKDFQFQNFSFSLNAQIKNIWNESYQVIQNMPMPGRNYLIGITIKI